MNTIDPEILDHYRKLRKANGKVQAKGCIEQMYSVDGSELERIVDEEESQK